LRRSAAVVLGVSALLALPVSASAATKTVYAGPPPFAKQVAGTILGPKAKTFVKTNHPDFDSFFSTRVTVNTGDTVSFLLAGFHTVDIPAMGQGDLPLIIPAGGTVSGVNDAAGNPFWFNGKVPIIGFNPTLFSPTGPSTYDGTTRIDSGLPTGKGKPKPLNVQFSKPGTYKFYCDVHPGMVGVIVVKPKGQSVPSAKQYAAAVKSQVTRDIKTAIKLSKKTVPAGQVSVGNAGRGGVELFNMFPGTLHVKVGAVVTFSMSNGSREVHTATFGPASYLKPLAKAFAAGPTLPPAAAYASDPPSAAIPLSPTSHGNGFANTGIMDVDKTTPNPMSGQIKFTKAGTYQFFCLVHPFMHGTVVVK
jgi:plastocyanin